MPKAIIIARMKTTTDRGVPTNLTRHREYGFLMLRTIVFLLLVIVPNLNACYIEDHNLSCQPSQGDICVVETHGGRTFDCAVV